MTNRPMEEFPLLDEKEGLALFYPHIPKNAAKYVSETLSTRWVGQGPKAALLEERLAQTLGADGRAVAVNSGTAALHLAYILSGVSSGDEVVCPVFTCTATNLPILYQGGIPVFCDINSTNLNISVEMVEALIGPKTKAISVVDYGGKPCDYPALRALCDKNGLSLIADCAHTMDGSVAGRAIHEYADHVIYSFQAIKLMTTGDGGLLVCRYAKDADKAKRLRWFGIDRTAKQKGIWENDVVELGYKYHMNDIAASIGLAALEELGEIVAIRRALSIHYKSCLQRLGLTAFEHQETTSKTSFTPWMVTINTAGKRVELMTSLREAGIESAQVHYRNDRYSIFRGVARLTECPNMNALEEDYLVLPLHTKMTEFDVDRVCEVVARILEC